MLDATYATFCVQCCIFNYKMSDIYLKKYTNFIQKDPDIIYSIHSHHRNGNKNKSQWEITDEEEVSCFSNSFEKDWGSVEANFWGLYISDNKIYYLGRSSNKTQLFIAKFVVGSVGNIQEWHGYPADPQQNNQDIPEDFILDKWIEEELINLAKKRKILKGQPCRI